METERLLIIINKFMNHEQKKTLARKLITRKEMSDGKTGLFDCLGWSQRKAQRIFKVANRIRKVKERKENRCST